MSQFLGSIFIFLTRPPGNLFYHFCLAFSIAGALQGAISLWRSSEFPQAKRTVAGLSVLMLLQVVLFITSGLIWQGLFTAHTVLPPLDRMITLLSLIWIAWLWVFPEPSRVADWATILLNLLALILFGLSLFIWLQGSTASVFSLSLLETVWQLTTLGFLLLGIIMLVVRQPNGWGNGLAMLGLAFAGHLLYIIPPVAEGDFPAVVRLFQLAFYPILFVLPQRFSTPATRPLPAQPETPLQERRRYSTDPKTFHALLNLAAELNADNIGKTLTRSIAQSMLADLCFLITMTGEKDMVITCGYDLIREESLNGTAINQDTAPLLANAIQRGRPLRLPASSTSSDLKGLGQILGLSSIGHLMSVPIPGKKGPQGAILLLSPYSNRLWSAEDQAFLSNVTSLFIPIMERGQRASTLDHERETAVSEVQGAQEQAAEATRKYNELLEQFESARQQLVQNQMQVDNVAAILAVQEESQQLIDQLKAENEQLREGVLPAQTADSDQLERELRLTLEEVAHLQNSLAEANIKILELEKHPNSPITNEQIEVIASISQELRQPMSSTVGYTDLLLSESVGILGSLQRKFLERVKSSIERIGGLVDDLIQITTLETGRMKIKPEPIDLNLIVDNAMAYTSSQIREKNITLRLDIPQTQSPIQADREAFQQILIHLLQNASSATPAEGTITLRLQLQHEVDQDYLLVQVSDTGGGIPANDIPQVFARRYRADNALIPGLGDTGVGLSIAKTLVEAQHGRIWADVETGVGSTFNVLLPAAAQEADEDRK